MSSKPDDLIIRKTGGFWGSERRNWCAYCGIELEQGAKLEAPNRASRDHLIPKAHNGGYVTVPCCRPCNRAKGNLSLPEFMATDYFSRARAKGRPNRASLRDLWLGLALAAVHKAQSVEKEDPEAGGRPKG